MNTAQIGKAIDAEVQRLREIRALLDPSHSSKPAANPSPKPGKRQVSAAGRARMAAAQKARWAKAKAVLK
jgi:hypothetical protein